MAPKSLLDNSNQVTTTTTIAKKKHRCAPRIKCVLLHVCAHHHGKQQSFSQFVTLLVCRFVCLSDCLSSSRFRPPNYFFCLPNRQQNRKQITAPKNDNKIKLLNRPMMVVICVRIWLTNVCFWSHVAHTSLVGTSAANDDRINWDSIMIETSLLDDGCRPLPMRLTEGETQYNHWCYVRFQSLCQF